ncbi:conserved repeat domain-containing protein [Paenibacillus sp. UNC496MF]|uniref:DUF11 domain-containing protein n=1 Tax=Paenibacillus sp. UNC496MF TaxID=1502753 RepID=UPI0008F0BFC7|nr:DUF11 domain-containing protein [Paenibacillus sp. UNC496MF]SFI34827.1 conserved repeat domain-containing protein [Paenibacillus sp. UNC496MF]
MIENDSLPMTIRNQSVVSFDSGSAAGFAYSNVVNTVVNGPVIGIAKTPDTAQAGLSLPLTFRLAVTNTGNRSANVTVYDTPPSGTVFVANSILVNGAPVPGITPRTGIPLGEVGPGSVQSIVFQLIVTSVPASGRIENQARADYSFVTLDHRTITGSALSNVASVPVTGLAVTLSKSVSNAVTFVGDMIGYSVLAANEGSDGIAQAVLYDPLPDGTAFVPGSVTVNGVRSPSSSPAAGIALGTIEPGSSKLVTFNAVVLDVPVQTRLTNRARLAFRYGQYEQSVESGSVTVVVSGPSLTAVLAVAPVLATIGDKLAYSLTIANAGTLETSVTVKDLIPAGTSYLAGTAALNGRPLPNADPATGIALGSLVPGQTFVLTFDVAVTREVLQPALSQIANRAIVDYAFGLPSGLAVTDTMLSNAAVTELVYPYIGATLDADPHLVEAGGSFLAIVRVANAGNYPASVILRDFVPRETGLEPGSVLVDGRPVSGATADGIPVGTLAAGGAASVTYVLRVARHPLQSRIRFRVRAAYDYYVNERSRDSAAFSNETEVRVEADEE